MKPYRGVLMFVFAIAATAGMSFFPGIACAQKSVHGEFKLSQPTHWEKEILPMGEYSYSVEVDPVRTVVRVWQKNGRFSGEFSPRSFVRNDHQEQSVIVLQPAEAGTYVSSIHVPALNAELGFSAPAASGDSNPSNAEGDSENNTASASKSEFITFINPAHENVTFAEPQKVYLRVCEVIEREFNRPTPVRPQLILRLGAEHNWLRYPSREIQLKKWDEIQFAEGVVDLALHDMVPADERIRLSKAAVSLANMTVSLCELKNCTN